MLARIHPGIREFLWGFLHDFQDFLLEFCQGYFLEFLQKFHWEFLQRLFTEFLRRFLRKFLQGWLWHYARNIFENSSKGVFVNSSNIPSGILPKISTWSFQVCFGKSCKDSSENPPGIVSFFFLILQDFLQDFRGIFFLSFFKNSFWNSSSESFITFWQRFVHCTAGTAIISLTIQNKFFVFICFRDTFWSSSWDFYGFFLMLKLSVALRDTM